MVGTLEEAVNGSSSTSLSKTKLFLGVLFAILVMFSFYFLRANNSYDQNLTTIAQACDKSESILVIARPRPCLVSYVIFDQRSVDTNGAIRHSEAIPYVYPGCKMLLYYDNSTVGQEFINKMIDRNVALIAFNASNLLGAGWNISKWAARVVRYWAIDLPDWEVLHFRDLDSGIWFREKVAVDEFLNSDALFHSFRDHPAHWWPVMGGMWGLKREGLSYLKVNLTESLRLYLNEKNNHGGTDQVFLADVMWPAIREETMAHDAYYCNTTHHPQLKSKYNLGFPTQRFGKVIAANYLALDGTPVPVDNEVTEVPVECRRRKEWKFG